MRIRLSTIVILLTILGPATIFAQQWEPIGWNGGAYDVIAQIDDILFARGQYAYYRSSDLGKSWKMIRDGLPLTIYAYDGSLTKFNDRLYLYAHPLQSNFEFGTGIYSIGKNETQWSYRDIKPIHRKKVLTPPTFFYGNDSILTCSRKSNNEPDSVQGIFLSLNNGVAWERKMSGLPDSILEIGMNNLEDRILLEVSHVDNGDTLSEYYVSRNKAESWEKLNNFPTIGYPDYLRIVNNSLLFIPVTNYLNSSDSIITMYLSLNKGEIWDTISLTVSHKAEYLRASRLYKFGSKMYLYVNGDIDSTGVENGDTVRYTTTKSYLYTSTNNGTTWDYLTMSDSASFMSIVIGNDDLIMVGYQGQTSTTDTSFSTFEPITDKGIMAEYRTLYHTSGRLLFASEGTYEDDSQDDKADTIHYSTDNGDSWGRVPFLAGYTLFGLRWVQAGTNVYALGRDTSNWKTCIYQSQDSGFSWKVVSYSQFMNTSATLYGFEDTLLLSYSYTVNDTHMYLSSDAGKTWDGIAEPTDDYGLFPAKYDGDILSCMYEYDPDKFSLYYSTDLGKEWKQCNFPYTSFANGPFIIGKRWFVITNEDTKSEYFPEIFYSDDNGSNWIQAKGIPPNMVLRQICSDNGILYTIGNSMPYAPGAEGRSALFFSLDSGRSWQRTHDQFLTADRLFFGSDYLYVTGIHELLRMTKSLTGIDDNNTTHNSHTLSAYPNPSTDEMRIRFSTEMAVDVSITIFDMMGRQISKPIDEQMGAGTHEVLWDTRTVPSGSYLVELTASDKRTTKMVTVLK